MASFRRGIATEFFADNQGITITVDDDNLSIYPKGREQIFRPFCRTDEAGDRQSGGTGLAIVETAVSQHPRWGRANDSPLGGLCMILWLPLHMH